MTKYQETPGTKPVSLFLVKNVYIEGNHTSIDWKNDIPLTSMLGNALDWKVLNSNVIETKAANFKESDSFSWQRILHPSLFLFHLIDQLCKIWCSTTYLTECSFTLRCHIDRRSELAGGNWVGEQQKILLIEKKIIS